ncbi:MAG: hypothetical protein ABSA49_07685 [Rhizomicrobium sp.]|jgi:hypothetical protein
MGILLGFVPFILFALLTNISDSLALWVAFASAFAIGIRDFAHTKILRVLDVGSIILFGLLALYAGFVQPSLSLQAVRLVIDCGLLSIALVSMAIRNPFTLQYAREQTPQEFWDTPVFIRTNYVITTVWALSFLVTTAADATATFNKKFPLSLDIGIGLAALALAVVFTARYPGYVRAHVQRSVAEAARRTA